MHRKKWILLLLVLFLTACSSLTPPQAPSNQALSWDKRVQTLSNIEDWDLKALISIRSNAASGQRSVTANINWQQQQRHYTLLLFGPLGANAATLTGRPGHIELKTADGKVSHASTPELLLAQQLGWQLPVSNLYYWVRGLPVPNLSAEKHFDNFHHLTDLNQNGWHVQFSRYTAVHAIDLPSKIFIDNQALQIKLIIEQWQLNR